MLCLLLTSFSLLSIIALQYGFQKGNIIIHTDDKDLVEDMDTEPSVSTKTMIVTEENMVEHCQIQVSSLVRRSYNLVNIGMAQA